MLKGDERPVVREIRGSRHRIRLDLSQQVLHLSVPEESVFTRETSAGEQTIHPTLRDLPFIQVRFVPAGLLVHKAKQFDDGLYAAVELAAQNGAARFPGKAMLLSRLAHALSARPEAREAYGLLLAARQLGGARGNVPADLRPIVDRILNRFLADQLESKPLGFYTWIPELEAIFRQDRLLQLELLDGATVQALVSALRSDVGLRESYEGYLALVSRLTNPFAKPDLRPFAVAPQRRPAAGPPFPCFFPPSVSHEGELAKRLLGDRPIPEGFSLVDEMIRGIRAGTLRLEPTSDSGWYDYQTWSHEPLVIPETTPEAQRLRLDDSYRKELLELFKGAQALARETHVKALELESLGLSLLPEEEHPEVIQISPELTVEPLATLYNRRALGYRFVRGILEGAFGATGLRQMRRLTPDGPAPGDLGTELADMEALFRGAYASVAAQIGMPPDPSAGNTADAKRFAAWANSLATDADLSRDARMMVPIFHDVGRRMTKVWVFLGWAAYQLDVDFATPPTAQVFDRGHSVARRLSRHLGKNRGRHSAKDVELDFVSEFHILLRPVTAEVYVTRLLNRDEFRDHCDRLKTRSAILSGLT